MTANGQKKWANWDRGGEGDEGRWVGVWGGWRWVSRSRGYGWRGMEFGRGKISVYNSAKRLGYKPILGKKGLGKRGSNLGRGHGEGLEKGKGEEG